MYVKICGYAVKCFTDIGDDIVISPHYLRLNVGRAVDILVDNGIFWYLRRNIDVNYDIIIPEFVRAILKNAVVLRPKIVRVIAPDYPYDAFKNMEWCKDFLERFWWRIERKLRELKVEKTMVYIVVHQFDKYLKDYIAFAKARNIYIAFPCRVVTFSDCAKNVQKLNEWDLRKLVRAIAIATEQTPTVHLLGAGKMLIEKIGCGLRWDRITFDTLAYRKSQGRYCERKAMVTFSDPEKLKEAFMRWWKGEICDTPSCVLGLDEFIRCRDNVCS